MIRKIYNLILILFLFLNTSLVSYSASTQEVAEIFLEGQSICFGFNERCEFKTIELNVPLAYTQYRKITVASGIYNNLSKNELRAIVYHEIGHALDHHSEKGIEYYNNFYMNNGHYPNAKEMKPFRYEYEYKADILCMYMLAVYKHPYSLDKALNRLDQLYNIGEACDTHPSVSDRVQRIKQLENNFSKGLY